MARKKSVSTPEKRTKAVTGTTSTPAASSNPMELGVAVSEVVQILSVALRRGSIESAPGIFTQRDDYQVRIAVEEIAHHLDVASHTLDVTASFSLAAVRRDDEAPGLAIRASFALTYELPPSSEFEESQLRAFAMTNGVYNAWPYWREYVQSTTTRMGLPPIIVPVFRL